MDDEVVWSYFALGAMVLSVLSLVVAVAVDMQTKRILRRIEEIERRS